jgi:hypothetical protein
MDVATIAAVISVPVGLSGWVAFAQQVQSGKKAAQSAGRRRAAEALDQLRLLIGEWIDAISMITEFSETSSRTCQMISDFNRRRGGFSTRLTTALNDVPDEPRFAEIRQSTQRFEVDAIDMKKGLIGHLSNAEETMTEAEWAAQRDGSLRELTAECDALQRLLQEESQHMRSA